MTDIDHKSLTRQAFESTCACWAYEDLDEASNDELRQVIATKGKVLHDNNGDICPLEAA